MSTFMIDRDDSITALSAGESAASAEGSAVFSSIEEFQRLADSWPSSRLVEIWNGIPGFTPVKRFTNRKTAVTRIWKAIQRLEGGAGQGAPDVAPHLAGPGRKAAKAKKGARASTAAKVTKAGRKAKPAGSAREGSKTAKILDLLKRPNGVTLREIVKATGWMSHSVRGFISGAVRKKMGLTVESSNREDGDRVYKITR